MDPSDVLLGYSKVFKKLKQVRKVNDFFAVLTHSDFRIVSRDFSFAVGAFKHLFSLYINIYSSAVRYAFRC